DYRPGGPVDGHVAPRQKQRLSAGRTENRNTRRTGVRAGAAGAGDRDGSRRGDFAADGVDLAAEDDAHPAAAGTAGGAARGAADTDIARTAVVGHCRAIGDQHAGGPLGSGAPAHAGEVDLSERLEGAAAEADALRAA